VVAICGRGRTRDEPPTLPAEWTPSAELVRGWSEWARTHYPPRQFGAAYRFRRAQFFGQWRDGEAELAGRELKEDAPLQPVAIYPPSERWSRNFKIGRGHLTHLTSGRIHYDFHYRRRQAASAPPQLAAPSSRRQKGATDQARADLLYEAARAHAGADAWSTDLALAEARKQFPKNPLFAAQSIRTFSAAWVIARNRLREEAATGPR
jgi:hypothetical protein